MTYSPPTRAPYEPGDVTTCVPSDAYVLGVILTLGDPISTQASLLVLLRGRILPSTLHVPTRRDAR